MLRPVPLEGSIMNLRSLPWMGKVALVVLIAAAVAGAGWGGRELLRHRAGVIEEAPAVSSTEAAAPAKPRTLGPSTHPPIVALRDRMLQHYHGKATNLFTDIPGFGLERMQPLYEKVPFEVTFFSPGELEVAEGAVKSPGPLMDVFAKSLTSFQDPARHGAKPNPPRTSASPGTRPNSFGFVFGDTVAYGLQLRMLDLVGLTDRQNPKVYSGGKAFELVRVNAKDVKKIQEQGGEKTSLAIGGTVVARPRPASTEALQTRALDFFEMAGVEELQKGKDVYIRTKDKAIRMLGALRASGECLTCHTDAGKGELLGAFSYTFVDTNRSLTKEDKKK